MSYKVVECIPNFSEGQNADIIKQITDEIEKVDGIQLLDVDPGYDMNRTVVTFVGEPERVKLAAFQAIKKASELIDMSKHRGSHPRMGATDVCPFVPVSGITIEECVQLSKEVAEKVGNELGIPVYLYEKSAQSVDRKNLAKIRQGEYEGLSEKLKKPEWKPDYGPAEFNSIAGATVIGVREFLIAYNINLNSREKLHATDIAFELREKGRSVRKGNISPFYFMGSEILEYSESIYPCGSCEFVGATIKETISHCQNEHDYSLVHLLEQNGIDPMHPENNSVKKPGLFSNCKAIGWMVPNYDRAQISINLTDYNITSMHHVLEATRKMAAERGLVVTGSEIVGMVPFPALLETGKYYLSIQGRSVGIPIKDILETAVQSLGLTDVAHFNIKERVLGLPQNPDDALIEMTLTEFVDEVSRESPAPGGGSIAALAGALGASLSSMVSNLSTNKRGSENIDGFLNNAAEKAQTIKNTLLKAVDEDTKAFNSYMEARRLPQQSEEQKVTRNAAILKGLKEAVVVPFNTANESYKVIELAEVVAKYGNPNSITDIGVGAQIAYTGVLGGIYNVLINLKDINDEEFNSQMRRDCQSLKENAISKLNTVLSIVEEKL